MKRLLSSALLVCCVSLPLLADDPSPKNGNATGSGSGLAEYVSPEKAATVSVRTVAPDRAGLAGYLGVHVATKAGKLTVVEVQPESPADKAGLKPGDVIRKLDDREVRSPEALRDYLLGRAPGEEVRVVGTREDKPLEATATLKAVSRPMRLGVERVTFGAQVGDPKEGDEGTPVERVTPNSPAARAGLKTGDVILRVEGTTLKRARELADLLSERRAGDALNLVVRRGDEEIEAKVTLTVDRTGGPARAGRGGFGGRGVVAGPAPSAPWTKPVYRLAVVGIEFDDVKHNDKIPLQDWESALFSEGTYTKNVTGQEVPGSLNDYFREQSYGQFRIEGKMFDWVSVSKKRGDYSQGSGTSNRGALPGDALSKLLAREGRDALRDFDGLFVLYAGSAVRTNRGGVFYPHAGTLGVQGRPMPYLLSYEGGERMATLGAFCREFAYLLGLPDLAARTENIGSEGVGAWCLMGGPVQGRPQGLCAWSKERLGWVKPAVIDPTVKQKLILDPVSMSAAQCVKVLVRSDGSEYFLLENRTRVGSDKVLPGEGLLIWRVVGDRPVLEESHGIEGATGARALPDQIPYPTRANNAFTPFTTPSSRSARGGGLPVHITEIRRHDDGRITFHVGYDYL